MKIKIFFSIIFFFLFTSVYSKKIKIHDVIVYKYKKYILNNTELTQSKNGLTIEIVPLHPGLIYKYPKLFSWDISKMPNDWESSLSAYYQQNPDDGKRYEYSFGADNNFLTVFYVKITNNTDHIIRMKDARIYLLVDSEDPIRPTMFFGNAQLEDVTPSNASIFKSRTILPVSYLQSDGSLVDQVTKMYYEWNKNRKKGILHFNYPIGFPSQVLYQNKIGFKLINGIKAEIIPDFSYSGILFFNRLIKNNEEINISMYDFPTKNNDAGIVIEKSNFKFNLKEVEGIMYYDRNAKKWKEGNPPEKVEYYVKKQKKWYYGLPAKK